MGVILKFWVTVNYTQPTLNGPGVAIMIFTAPLWVDQLIFFPSRSRALVQSCERVSYVTAHVQEEHFKGSHYFHFISQLSQSNTDLFSN